MINYGPLLQEIDETRMQLGKTESKKRKYQLHRRLNKLKNEFRIAKMYEAEAKRRKG